MDLDISVNFFLLYTFNFLGNYISELVNLSQTYLFILLQKWNVKWDFDKDVYFSLKSIT